jgi:hypothetical protein
MAGVEGKRAEIPPTPCVYPPGMSGGEFIPARCTHLSDPFARPKPLDKLPPLQYNGPVPLEGYVAGRADFLPVLSVGVIGSCAADVHEPRQVREEATVNGPLWVP